MSSAFPLKAYTERVDQAQPFPSFGAVTNISGFLIEGFCEGAVMGGICEIYALDRQTSVEAEVVGFRDNKVLLMPFGEVRGVGLESQIVFRKKAATIKIGPQLVGRVLDGMLNPLDALPPPECEDEFSIYSQPVNPLKRERIHAPLDLGIRAVNGMLTVGKGQRVGIMSGSGVGKSVLLGMLAKYTEANVNVIALIGERGREVREFVERDLGPQGLARSVIVCATSDASPVLRTRTAFVAATIAEYFRKGGNDVLFMMDSVTRFAMAQREIGLAAGEPPTTKGYPPSVFTLLPKLCERAGNTSSGGSITGIYTVLIEADDINDPIGDSVRSIVDGHVVLSRKLASKNHFPAIDVPLSTSRVMGDVTSPQHRELAARVRSVLANYAEAEDLINIGAYVKGSNPQIDEAITYIEPVRKFLRQSRDEAVPFNDCLKQLAQIFQSGSQQNQSTQVATRR